MRKSREELLKHFPSWNEKLHDIVEVQYGDVPLIHYDEKEYEWYCKLEDGTLKNLETANAYIYSRNGEYDLYRTDIGEFRISTENGNVLCGSVNLKYNGKSYDITINNMYGKKGLSILRLNGQKVGGWCNKDGLGSPSLVSRTEELDSDVIDKVFSRDIKDYGQSVHKFIETAKNMYESDTTNYIMNKCWNS